MLKTRISKYVLFFPITVIIFFTVILGYFWNNNHNNIIEKEIKRKKYEQTEEIKKSLRLLTITSSEILNNSWLQEKKELAYKLKSHISFIKKLLNLHIKINHNYPNDDIDIWSVIPQKSNETYFYTISPEDHSVTLPATIKAQNNIPEHLKILEESQINEIINLAKSSPDGFYLNLDHLYSIPTPPDNHLFFYNSFATYLPAYNIILGITIQKYLIEKNILDTIQSSINKIGLNQEFKLFIYTQNGLCLLHSDKEKTGKNIYNYLDKNGLKINRVLIAESIKKSGVFFKYLKHASISQKDSEILVFSNYLPEIDCIVGCEYNTNYIKEFITIYKNMLLAGNKNENYIFYSLLVIMLIITFTAFMLFLRHLNRIIVLNTDNSPTEPLNVNQKVTTEKDYPADNNYTNNLFLNLSHELRTPLNIIIGLQQILFNTVTSPKERNHIVKSHYAANNLLKIIDNIIQYFKINANLLTTSYSEFNLELLIRNLFRNLNFDFNDKNIELITDFSTDLPQKIKTDALLLTHALNNLLNTSLKTTFKGDIILRIYTDEEKKFNRTMFINFEIKDNGIGIPLKEQKTIFQTPNKNTTPSLSDYNDILLNIFVCQKIAKLLDGEFKVKSIINQGSQLTLSIPVTSCSDTRIHNNNKIKPEPKILIISNNTPTIQVIKKYLEALKLSAEVALSANKAIEIINKNSPVENDFNIILYDQNTNDLTYAKDIISRIKTKCNIPETNFIILAMDIKNSLHINKAYNKNIAKIVKPILPTELYTALNNNCRHATGMNNIKIPASIMKKPILDKLNLLLVEDNPINQEITKVLLESLGCKVVTASNGLQAIELTRRNNYDIILMDIQMPKLNGMEATTKIREFNKNIPIIALTAHTINSDRNNFIKAGMTDHIIKPLKMDNIMNIICKHTDKKIKEVKLPQKTDSNQSYAASDIEVVFNSLKSISGIDLTDGLTNTGNDKQIFLELMKDFTKFGQEVINEISKAEKDNDIAELKRLIHSLKGSTSSLGFHESYNLALQSESLLTSKGKVTSEDLSALKENLNKLISEIKNKINR